MSSSCSTVAALASLVCVPVWIPRVRGAMAPQMAQTCTAAVLEQTTYTNVGTMKTCVFVNVRYVSKGLYTHDSNDDNLLNAAVAHAHRSHHYLKGNTCMQYVRVLTTEQCGAAQREAAPEPHYPMGAFGGPWVCVGGVAHAAETNAHP